MWFLGLIIGAILGAIGGGGAGALIGGLLGGIAGWAIANQTAAHIDRLRSLENTILQLNLRVKALEDAAAAMQRVGPAAESQAASIEPTSEEEFDFPSPDEALVPAATGVSTDAITQPVG